MRTLILFFLMVSCSYQLHAVETSALQLTGSISNINQCTINAGGSGIDVGIKSVADLTNNGAMISNWTVFNTTVSCTNPTAIIIEFSGILPRDPNYPSSFGLYLTSSGKVAARLYGNIGSINPTLNGNSYLYSEVGHLDLGAMTGGESLTAINGQYGYAVISSDPASSRSAFAIIDSNGAFVFGKDYVFPWGMGVWSSTKSSGWTNDLNGITLSLNTAITLSLYTI